MQIKIYHTNDVHSTFDNYNRITSFIQDMKKKYRDSMLYVDIGDHVDRSHPLTEATRGVANVEMLNEAQCDVATIGNNEGITLEKKDLETLYESAEFDVICANLRHKETHELLFKPYVIKEVNGIKIGFVAATVEFTPFYEALDWEVSGAIDWIEKAVNEIKDTVDVIIVMSHLGMYDDELIANRMPEVDVILGGHTHHHFENGEWHNNTLMGAAGRFGDYVGEITLEIEDGVVAHKSAKLVDVNLLSSKHDKSYDRGKQLLSEPIFETTEPIERRLLSASRFMTALSNVLLSFTNSHATLINTGLVVKPFYGGELTMYELHKVLPHAINAVRIELTGRELKEVIHQSEDHEFQDMIVKGMGFRGDIFGRFVMHNVGYVESKREYFVYEGSSPVMIDDHETYYLGTLDMYTFGRIFPQFKSAKKDYLIPDMLRDIVKVAYEENAEQFKFIELGMDNSQ